MPYTLRVAKPHLVHRVVRGLAAQNMKHINVKHEHETMNMKH
jgi:hypothetical protein